MANLTLNFLGDLEVLRDGERLTLPPSKKTRALLAYLVLNGRPFGRERLCDLLWEIPDDPRGALRWSLSKLRRLVDEPGTTRIVADRLSVGFDGSGVDIDVVALKALAADAAAGDSGAIPVEALEAAAARFRGSFLEGLDLSRYHDFHSWCLAEREAAIRAQVTVLDALVGRLGDAPERALPHARARVGLAPYDESAWVGLIRLLTTLNKPEEAQQQYQMGVRLLKEAGITPSGALHQARSVATGRTAGSTQPGVVEAPRAAAAAMAATRAPVIDAPVPAPAAPPASAARIVGRDEELRRLADAFARTRTHGRAGVVLLMGEPGIGKTRLLRAAIDLALLAGSFVLEASAFEMGSIRPYALWTDAFRRLGPGEQRDLLETFDYDNRDRLFGALSGRLAEEAANRPVVIVFDDLQWCDESSAAVLHYVARMNRHRPLLGILAGRDEELYDNGGVQRALRGLRHDGLLEELKLRPLSAAAIEQIIEQHAPGADWARLGRQAGGNPLLAIELTRAVAAADGSGSLADLVRERLARLDAEASDMLRWAAVVAPRIDVTLLARITGLDAVRIAEAFEAAERHAVLQTTDCGYRFTHDLISRSVYAEISPTRRRIMHRRVAEVLQQDTALDLGIAADLAHHAVQSEDAGMAAQAMVSAGRLCLRFFANEDAQNLARRGMTLVQRLGDVERVCLSLELHDVLLKAGPLPDWEAAAREYVLLAEQALDHGALAHARLGYQMASIVRWQHGQWAGAREQTLQAERATRSGTEQDQVVSMAETARCLAMLERDIGQADSLLLEAQALAARNRISHQAIPLALGLLRFHDNALAEAEELFKDGRMLSKVAGDRDGEFQANEHLVLIALERGDYASAELRCEALVDLGEKLRDGSEAPFSRALQGLCRYAMDGDAAPLETALEGLRIADAKHRLATVLMRTALLDLEQDRPELAIARASEALQCAEVLDRATERMLAHCVLAECYRLADDPSESERHAAAAVRLDDAPVAAWARLRAERLRLLEA
jgi:DNA-binding SARP family transcriptional activator